MGLYKKWGRKPFGFIEGLIFGFILILFALFILVYPLVSMIVNHEPWHVFVFVIPLCLYASFLIFGCGVISISEAKDSRKKKKKDFYDIS